MKTTDKEKLLNDVVSDDSYLAFRAGLFGRIRAGLRRERATARARKVLAWAACVAIAFSAFLLGRRWMPTPGSRGPEIEVVRTAPLHANQIVTTAATKTGSGTTGQPVVFLVTAPSHIEVIHSVEGAIVNVNDEQLLNLFKGQTVVLVHVGPNEGRLVFPADSSTQ